ncbi:MAG: hypothetical protein ABW189_08740 [Rickettsiales bacterium]
MTISATPDFPAARHALLAWYGAFGRKNLPWRNTSDPYRVYVSEIMLQQTQVSTVASRFYGPFLERFPSLAALASAREPEVLKAWEGLGYYSRARNMHKAAQQSAPSLPDTPEALKKLPGIGEYVAHAVACFGFGKQVPVVDVNVRRVLCRLTATENPPDKEIWRLARAFLGDGDAYSHNQALLDLGATVCTARKASCILCPLSHFCAGKDAPLRYPSPKKKKDVPIERLSVGAYISEGDVYMRRRETAFLGGYYALPEISRNVASREKCIGCVSQQYSHKRIEASVYVLSELPGEWNDVPGLLRIKTGAEKTPPLSAIDKKMLALLDSTLPQVRMTPNTTTRR